MGIPYYFYTLYKTYATKNLMINKSDLPSLGIDTLLLDYNSMIHPCAQKVLKLLDKEMTDNSHIEKCILNECMLYTRYTINVLGCQNVYVMIDGVAPRAKINQQRERRYKSFYLKQLQYESENNCVWDSNNITPGTQFMEKIKDMLFDLQVQMAKINVQVCISDSDDPGEGEHKMMKLINNNLIKEGKICIYGLDADLIMLCLLSKRSEDIILLRDNSFNEKLQELDRTFTYLDIGELSSAIYSEMTVVCKASSLSKRNIIRDYIFLCFLLGNDFLHNLPSLMIKENGLNTLIKIYTKLLGNQQSFLVQDEKTINLKFLRGIFQQLSTSENYFFSSVYSVYKRDTPAYRDNIPLASTDNIIFYADDLIKYNQHNFKQRYYLYYGISNVQDCCKHYLEGLYWILGYYHTHSHDNWEWFFPYHNTPFVSDLVAYLNTNMYLFEQQVTSSLSLSPSKPLSTLEQLFMVLPRTSLVNILKGINKDLGNKVERLFRTNSSFLQLHFPEKICLDMIHKEYLWQSTVFFEHFDKSVLQEII